MIITIEIPDQYVEIYRKWASVGRTLDAASALCDVVIGADDTTDAEKDQANHTDKEICAIRVPLDTLHKIVQQEIWRLSR